MAATPDGGRGRAGAREWTPDQAEQAALEAGLGPLSPLHWKVIALYREELARTRFGPTLGRLASLCRLGTDDLHALFPGETDRLIARVAGSPPTHPAG
ncbi:MAG TPA: TusE/DsrC/DsvC family sulfur relay protein [Vicinamibacteria bacterium]|nr:TusE/DsrC/DsvC family sulfur relay protein [Vicinamibacteria bacterium]